MMKNRTSKGVLLSSGILIAIFVIPQLLFFWLAPNVPCRYVVYGFITGYTLFHLLYCAYLLMKKGLRIAAVTVHLSTVLVLVELIVCAVLLCLSASPSTASFSLTILSLVHFLVEAVLYKTLE